MTEKIADSNAGAGMTPVAPESVADAQRRALLVRSALAGAAAIIGGRPLPAAAQAGVAAGPAVVPRQPSVSPPTYTS